MKNPRHPVVEEDLRSICDADLPWSELEGRRFLVTGAAGMLPAYFVESLLFLNEHVFRRPAHVVGMVRSIERASRRFAEYSDRSDLLLVEHDVCREFEDSHFDYIIHAASPASPAQFGADPVGTLCPNTIGTYLLLEAAQRQGTKSLLFFSSGEVYGNIPAQGVPIQEDMYGALDPTNIRSCYGESKRMGETMCSAWSHQYGVPTKIVRPFHTYGPGMALGDGRVFSDFVANIVASENIVMTSDGSAARSYCYLADATQGFFTVLLKGKTAEPYNVGSDHVLTVRQLADLLVRLVPEKHLEVIRDDASAPTGYLQSPVSDIRPDLSKTAGLGWRPTTKPEEGFLRTLRSMS